MTNFKSLQIWYSRPDVQYEIIKFLYKREFALILPSWVKGMETRSTRMLRAHNVQHFSYLLNKGLRMFRGLSNDKEISTPYNFYYSLARYVDGIPLQTLNFSERDNSEWTKTHTQFMQYYDFLIDIDAGAHEDMEGAHYSTMVIVDLFDEKNIPYELRFSGKGFHIIIPSEYFPYKSFDQKNEDSIYKLYVKIAKYLRNTYSDMIDLGIYDSRRICKLPYSWALYEDSAYLCNPFVDKKDFLDFNLAQYGFLDKIGTAPDCLNIRGRGTKVFNSQGTINPLLELI